MTDDVSRLAREGEAEAAATPPATTTTHKAATGAAMALLVYLAARVGTGVSDPGQIDATTLEAVLRGLSTLGWGDLPGALAAAAAGWYGVFKIPNRPR